MICANFAHESEIARVGHRCHISPQRLGDLHCERPDAARRTIDHDSLARLELAFVPNGLQCRECRDWHGRGFLESDIRRHQVDPTGFSRNHVVRQGALRSAKYTVTRLEARDIRADCLHRARVVDTEPRVRRGTPASPEPHQIGLAPHLVPIERIDGCAVHLDENVIGTGRRPGQGLDSGYFRCAIASVDDRLHRVCAGLLSRRCAGAGGVMAHGDRQCGYRHDEHR